MLETFFFGTGWSKLGNGGRDSIGEAYIAVIAYETVFNSPVWVNEIKSSP